MSALKISGVLSNHLRLGSDPIYINGVTPFDLVNLDILPISFERLASLPAFSC